VNRVRHAACSTRDARALRRAGRGIHHELCKELAMSIGFLGLGTMGQPIAHNLLRAGHALTVWNRSAARADALVREGALRTASAAAAVRAAEFVVICVHDYAAADSFLRDDGVASGLAGRVVVQLTTGSPQEARDSEGWVQRHGGAYVDGALQAAPAQMGTPDTPILVSGANDAYRRAEPLLRLFGGGLIYLGESAGAAATMDLATLSYLYGSIIGFLHGARISEVEGIRLTDAMKRRSREAQAKGLTAEEHRRTILRSHRKG
jgi:3-hydroxyisobutyrate dehydrogenase-like beta-hydroxyacid dehydrogenase